MSDQDWHGLLAACRRRGVTDGEAVAAASEPLSPDPFGAVAETAGVGSFDRGDLPRLPGFEPEEVVELVEAWSAGYRDGCAKR